MVGGKSRMPIKNQQIGVETRQSIQLNQRLIMSSHMQQALKLLQMPLLELEPFIEEQVVANPCLEIEDDSDNSSSDEENHTQNDQESDQDETEVQINDKDLTILSRLEEDLLDHFAQNEPASPVRKSIEEEKLKTYLEQSIREDVTLQEQLKKQARDSFETEREVEIAEILIGYIDEFGFLKTPHLEICKLHNIHENELKPVLAEIQTFDPFGVGASTIQESLLIQLRCLKKENTLAYLIIRNHYEELLHNQIPLIQKGLKCTYDEIQEAIEKHVSKLDLHPGSHFSNSPVQAIIPDATLRLDNDKLTVDIERDFIPTLRLNLRYLKMLTNPDTTQETRQFVRQHLFSARWLVRNLQQRFSTLERIVQSLAVKQYEFFTKPDGLLAPLVMKSLAEELNVHESTIARTVSNKYINSPRGIFPLRSFFTNKYVSEEGEDLSSTTVKDEILRIISKEDKKHPYSDEKISSILKEKGIPCARRTVTKYRLLLNLGNTQQRKKYH